MDAVTLSRLQFAVTSAFHYIFPPMSIGLGVLLVCMEGMYLRTKLPIYEQMTKFWLKIFGLIFAMGVATGIVLEFQFGTNWSAYSRYVGDIFGSALAAEGIFAFFLESSFLALLVFGWNKVSSKVHFFSTCMVCLGSIFSALWIIIANSWMQTPVGYHIINGRAEITDFWAVVFNPSAMVRLSHVLCGALQAGAFLFLAVHAYYLLRKRHEELSKAAFKIGLIVACVASIVQPVTGHFSAMVISKYQPAKMAAVEGHFVTGPAPLYLMGWVDEKNEKTIGIGMPGMLSFLIYQDTTKPVQGLQDFPSEDRPPMLQMLFQSYHIMVALGMAMLGICVLGLFLWKKGLLFQNNWVLLGFILMVLAPQISNQLGWFVAEVGRQPWIVYGVLRTSAAVSPNLPAGQILASLLLFILVYILLFILFLFVFLHKIQHGPETLTSTPEAPIQQ